MSFSYKDRDYCTTKDLALSVIGGRLKIAIVWCLLQKPELRLSEIQKKLPTANQRMLIRQLRELEDDNIIYRTIYDVTPQKVDYRLTEIGRLLEPVVQSICTWGDTFYKSLDI